MIPFFAFVLVGVSLAQQNLYKSPNQFPGECEAQLANVTPRLQLSSFTLDGQTLPACVSVGGQCTTNKDCPKPDKKACQAEFGINIIFPGLAQCVGGVCREVSKDKQEECDCLTGCSFESSLSLRLTCTNGQCLEPPCAPCGQPPNNRKCCPGGVIGHDGNCFCASFSSGCLGDSDCRGGASKCCRGGKYDGMCCNQCSNPLRLALSGG